MALTITATTLDIECACGGMVIDSQTGGGFIAVGITQAMQCLDCDKTYDLREILKGRKTVRV